MRRAALALALAAQLAAGCAAVRIGGDSERWREIVPGRTTKEELYARLGAPDRIDWRGQDRVLRYTYAEAEGMGFGGGYYVTFLFRKIRIATDAMEVRVDPEDVVREVRAWRATPALERPWPWPFGD